MPGHHLRAVRLLSSLLRPERRGREGRQLPQARLVEIEAQNEEEDGEQIAMIECQAARGFPVSTVAASCTV